MRDATQVKTHPLVLTGAKSCGATAPPMASTLVTSSIMIVGLIISEQVSRYIIFNLKVRACMHVYMRVTMFFLAPPLTN